MYYFYCMAKFISAGHCNLKGPNYDPGAVGVNGRTEASETVKMRDAVIKRLEAAGHKVTRDLDGESLKQYLARIKTGTGSVVVEFHFNAFNGKATGVEVLVQRDADKMDTAFAKELAVATSTITGLPLRKGGVISEKDSARGSLGLMRESGLVALIELSFIDNPADMASYDKSLEQLAEAYARIIIKYDDMLT